MNKRYLIGGIGGIVVILSLYFLWDQDVAYDNRHFEVAADTTVVDSATLNLDKPTILYGFEVDSMILIEGRIKRNQNLSEILDKYNISRQKIHELSIASKPVFDVRKIVVNRKYTLICYPDSLQTAKAMVYEPSATEYVVFNLDDSVSVKKVQKEIITRERHLAGTIELSLAVTMDELGASPQLTNDIVDVFGWQIDFFRLQKGDQFKMIYEEKLVDNEVIGFGDIKAMFFQHFGNDYYAYYFNQGNGIDYFDEEGNSLRKAFLKYPLDFTRISSRYSGNRYHPVQKRWKAHRGTDFAAPRGTPIRSVGDGIVLDAKYGVNNGNFVKIRHNATYATQYLHMSKIASGIRPGVKVKQGQTIGFVGSTGLARGNHLCYRFWKNGVQIDALKVKLPPSEPIHEDNKIRFAAVRDAFREQLDSIELQAPIAMLREY
jgi:murein DD-endopeptidase MepM/ murein hydrolase activator NlpD